MDTTQNIIQRLKLEPHPEGGYFCRAYQSDAAAQIGPNSEERKLFSSIYYLLTRDSPVGHLHVNRSDILHYFHAGEAITYYLVSPDGELRVKTLGPDLDQGHQFQLLVPGGWWKASELRSGDYGLISEAVSPGFAAEDMRFVSKSEMIKRHPDLSETLGSYCRD